jgi:UDP-N-acetylmuramoyl-tripeptide--D-alanyl-D-alanine ligase
VAETKGALYAALPVDGIAIINDDDPFAGFFTALAQGRRQLRFGLGANADIGARALELGAHSLFTLRTPTGDAEVKLPLAGKHNIHNALAAAAIAYTLDISLGMIVRGLERVEPVKGRLVRHERSGWTLIDDSYNANPGSTAAAIATLVLEAGEPWLVLGDMKELGAQAQALHAQTGALAKRSGVVRLLTVGELSRSASEAFGTGARHFADQDALAKTLIAELRPGVRCLIKGSRSSAMERVVQAVLDQQAGNGGGRHAA